MAETRITGGRWRGRTITTPRGLKVRPTRSMVREAIFNILGQAVSGWEVIDLYAGAGSIGFEALSRGAAHVTFVERSAPALRMIVATADRLGCRDAVTPAHGDALTWIRRHPGPTGAADLCFLDAPYRDQELGSVLETLGDLGPARAVCEHHVARELPAHPGRMVQTRRSTYGLTAVTFYERESEV